MPANWDQEVRQARVALQTEVLAELGDHPTTISSSTSQDQNQDQDQGRDLSSTGNNPPSPMGLAHGKGLMKSFSPSEQAVAMRRAGIRGTNQRKGNPLSGKKKKQQMVETGESLSLSSSSLSSTPLHTTPEVIANPPPPIDGGGISSNGGGTSFNALNGRVFAGGLSLDQAQGLEGVAKVGHDQPAWKE